MIGAVAASRGDLGIFRLDQGASAGIWWRDLIGADGAQDHRAPALHRAARPSGRHAGLRIAKPLADAAVRDIVLYAARFERWSGGAARPCRPRGEVSASAADADGSSVLVAAPGGVDQGAPRGARSGAGLTTSPRSAATPPASASNRRELR